MCSQQLSKMVKKSSKNRKPLKIIIMNPLKIIINNHWDYILMSTRLRGIIDHQNWITSVIVWSISIHRYKTTLQWIAFRCAKSFFFCKCHLMIMPLVFWCEIENNLGTRKTHVSLNSCMNLLTRSELRRGWISINSHKLAVVKGSTNLGH